MPITNSETHTRIDEIASGIFRISTPIPSSPALPGGFSFNQFLIVDDQPLLFHTGPKRLFPVVRQAVSSVIGPERLSFVGFSHTEGDESGSLLEWLAAAPNARPLCSRVAAMVYADDATERAALAMVDGETLVLGERTVRWFDAPHVPHGWDCGFLGETSTATLFCGDLFTQPGADHPPITDSEVLGPSEAMRKQLDYYAHAPTTRDALERLASFEPRVLACMHGAAYRGDGAAHLRALAAALTN